MRDYFGFWRYPTWARNTRAIILGGLCLYVCIWPWCGVPKISLGQLSILPSLVNRDEVMFVDNRSWLSIHACIIKNLYKSMILIPWTWHGRCIFQSTCCGHYGCPCCPRWSWLPWCGLPLPLFFSLVWKWANFIEVGWFYVALCRVQEPGLLRYYKTLLAHTCKACIVWTTTWILSWKNYHTCSWLNILRTCCNHFTITLYGHPRGTLSSPNCQRLWGPKGWR